MKLIICRHGEAGPAARDTERTLTERGYQETARVGQYFAAELSGACAYASPYIRTQQTLKQIASQTGLQACLTLDLLTPDSNPATVVEWLARQPESAFPMLLVTHQPLVSLLISLLAEGHYQGYYPMAPASVVQLEADVWAAGLAKVVSQHHSSDMH